MAVAQRMLRVRQSLVSTLGTLKENRFSYLLFLPTLLFLVFVLWFPLLKGIQMSFYAWPFVGQPTFVGLENYVYLLTWEKFPIILRATLIFALTTVVQLAIAIGAALAVYHQKKLRGVITGVFLLPYTMPPVVIGTIWLYLLDPSFGPIFQFLVNNGILQQPVYWSTHGPTAMAVITLVTAWTFWPFMFLLILSSRQGIAKEQYESAKMYGAGYFQMFRNITLPQLKSSILVAVTIRVVWNLAKVSQPYQMTKGGPGYQTSILAVQLYRYANEAGAMGMAFATGIILLLVTLILVLPLVLAFEREAGSGGSYHG